MELFEANAKCRSDAWKRNVTL